MEHAEVQSEWIAAMLNRTGVFSEVTTHRDLNGKDRATSAVLKLSGQALPDLTPSKNRVTSDERIGQ
jgi:release factor glutamine methyltransferase